MAVRSRGGVPTAKLQLAVFDTWHAKYPNDSLEKMSWAGL